MNTKPILFSGQMVRAILDGIKTQTRRIVKGSEEKKWHAGACGILDPGPVKWNIGGTVFPCPYGKPGDTLWVRETFAFHPCSGDLFFRADGDPYGAMSGWKWKPSIFMPRKASRITLEIESVRVERLQGISDPDAMAEGIEKQGNRWRDYFGAEIGWLDPRGSYRTLWESINGPGSWDANPFVWVITFKRIKP